MTARQAAEPETAYPNANKIFDPITDGFEHTTDLTVNSLAQHNPQANGRKGVKSRNRRSLTVDKNSAQQFRRERGVPRPIQCHLVFLFDLVARVTEALGELAIIR